MEGPVLKVLLKSNIIIEDSIEYIEARAGQENNYKRAT